MHRHYLSESARLRYFSEKSSGVIKLNRQFWPWIQVQLEFEWFDGKVTTLVKQ